MSDNRLPDPLTWTADIASPDALAAALRAPFPVALVHWKPLHVKGNRALAVAYVDARAVADRLDMVLGLANWQDSYDVLTDGSVLCRLQLRLAGEWIGKCDVGCPSEQPDEGDRRKAAFSDALKRAAVKFGVGRYLYAVPQQWCDYDPQKRRFSQPPRLPDWAKPDGAPSAAAAPGRGTHPRTASSPAGRLLPPDAVPSDHFSRRLAAVAESEGPKLGFRPRALLAYIQSQRPQGLPEDLAAWPASAEGVADQLAGAFLRGWRISQAVKRAKLDWTDLLAEKNLAPGTPVAIVDERFPGWLDERLALPFPAEVNHA